MHDDWDAKLVASLTAELGPAYEVRYPRMPHESEPTYPAWSAALRDEIARLDDGAIVVAHSLGATMVINAIAEHPPARRIGAIVLIAAPFVGEGGWPSEGWTPLRALGAKLPRGVPIFLFHGLADEIVPPSHVELYAREIPQARVHRLPGCDHQLGNDLREVAAVIRSLGGER